MKLMMLVSLFLAPLSSAGSCLCEVKEPLAHSCCHATKKAPPHHHDCHCDMTHSTALPVVVTPGTAILITSSHDESPRTLHALERPAPLNHPPILSV